MVDATWRKFGETFHRGEPWSHTMWSQGASPIHVAHVVNAPQSPEDNPVAKCLEASAEKSASLNVLKL